MKHYHSNDFNKNEAWLIFRIDTQIKNQPVDIYMTLEVSSNQLLAHEIAETELSQNQATQFLTQSLTHTGIRPNRIILQTGDPSELVFTLAAKIIGSHLECIPAAYLESLIAPIKQSFGEKFFSPSSVPYTHFNNDSDAMERECTKKMIPDSYDLCPCASGKKYKFCCKKIFVEIMEAMVAAENGNISAALSWIEKAKAIVGETAEVVCRESVVYSFCDTKKSNELLEKCLAIDPKHPRAHYLQGIRLAKEGNLQGAIQAYETAIAHYPKTDVFHLNEVYNNLGGIFYKMKNYDQARTAWEKALLYLPSDRMAQDNLRDFIYRRDKTIIS